jgi:hypothetical protein
MNSQQLEKEKRGSALALPTLDMAEIFSLVQAEARRELPTADLGLPKLHTPVTPLTLSRLSTPPLALELPPLGSKPRAVSLRPLDRETYRLLMEPPHGMANPVTLDVPVGLPRIINVATLKAMLGANSRDVVFHKSVDEDRWAICPDDYPVDLRDRTQAFKVREWAILS